jgi:ribosomal protein S18 acetylase RimI-like enzyme
MTLSIRRYESTDWPAIAAVHDAARLPELRMTVGEEAFLTLAETAEAEGLFDGELWVATQGDDVVGFVAFRPDEITWLYVDPSRQRQGIGRALLVHAIDRCGDVVHIEALDGNAPALALYRSVGFTLVETNSGRLAGNERFAATGHLFAYKKGRQQ